MNAVSLRTYLTVVPTDYVWQFDNGIVVGADGSVARVDLAIGYVELEHVPRIKMRTGMNEFARVVPRREAVERILAALQVGAA